MITETRLPDEDNRNIERHIFRLLADSDWRGALVAAERNLPTLVSHSPATLYAVFDAAPARMLAVVPRWGAMRTYIAHLTSFPNKPAVYPGAMAAVSAEMRPADRIVVLTARAAALRSLGWFDRAASEVDSGQDALRRLPSAEIAVLAPYLAMVLTQWGGTLALAGRLTEAMTILDRASIAARDSGNARAEIEASAERAWIAAIAGDGERSERSLAELERLRRTHRHIRGIRHGARLAQARRALDRLDFDEGFELLRADAGFEELGLIAASTRAMARARAKRGDAMAIRTQLEVTIEAVRGWGDGAGLNAAIIAIARGTLPAADGMHEAALLALRECPQLPDCAQGLVTTRVASAYLALGEIDRAIASAGRVAGSPLPRVRVEALAVRAAALYRSGNELSAVSAFREAVHLTETHGLPGSLVNLSRSDLMMLGAATDMLPLVRRIDRQAVLFAESPYGYVRLTPQQLMTLRALARTDTIDDAAELLGVSATTAKSHVQEIHRRFGVNNRGALLAEGRRRGLI